MAWETIRGRSEWDPQKWQIDSHQVALSRSHVFVGLDEQALADRGMLPFGWTEWKDGSLEVALEALRPQRYTDLRTNGQYSSETEDFVDYLAHCCRFA